MSVAPAVEAVLTTSIQDLHHLSVGREMQPLSQQVKIRQEVVQRAGLIPH